MDWGVGHWAAKQHMSMYFRHCYIGGGEPMFPSALCVDRTGLGGVGFAGCGKL